MNYTHCTQCLSRISNLRIASYTIPNKYLLSLCILYYQICGQLLSLCDYIKQVRLSESTTAAAAHTTSDSKTISETTRKSFKMRIFAAISREALKIGSSKEDKIVLKELVRVISAVSPAEWASEELVRVVY